jgi:hypothetical protein
MAGATSEKLNNAIRKITGARRMPVIIHRNAIFQLWVPMSFASTGARVTGQIAVRVWTERVICGFLRVTAD